mgnify:CR=1 FL=1
MNISQVPKYVNAIANMARWSQTTFIRTFYKFKPHMIEKKVKKLAQHPKVDGVYVTSEADNPKMNTSRQRHGSKPIKSRMIVEYLMTIDMPLLPLATLMVYSLRLSQRVKNISIAMGNYISSMMKKVRRYGESNNANS